MRAGCAAPKRKPKRRAGKVNVVLEVVKTKHWTAVRPGTPKKVGHEHIQAEGPLSAACNIQREKYRFLKSTVC